VPFLLTGLGLNQFLSFYAKFRAHLHKVELVSGVMLILIGSTIASGYATRLASSRLASLLPNLESRIKAKSDPVTNLTRSETGPFEPAPQVELSSLEGQRLKLSDFHGRVVLLNFWATWCGPCRAEIPELNKLERDFGASGLAVVGVSWDDSAAGVREFQNQIRQDYTVLLGGEDIQDKFEAVRSLPTTYVIDRKGRIRQMIIGARDRTQFEAVLKPLLDEQLSNER
jgi:thiol-disulfide isomerase/thioredoxin